ncbi:MAG: hypothetical protein ACD_29C00478G0007 [uncultured bacterium]|nr:MAG: hypothetical protein ACD_29C00478G0007 [uncultured bacterium]
MPKLNLIHLKGNSHYLSGRLSVGIYAVGNKAIIIDSGIDDDGAKSIDTALAGAGYQLSAIINTHSHADHCGGNAYFQKKYPAIKIFAAKHEQFYIEEPVNEPRFFCGAARPFKELRNKFLEAKPSVVTNTIHPYKDQDITIEGHTFKMITLPGHCPGMIGVVTEDNVVYLGDAMFGDETLAKHGILFYTDIEESQKSFDKIASLKVDAAVFYHGGLCVDLTTSAKNHKAILNKTSDWLLQVIEEQASISLDQLTQIAIQRLSIADNLTQFVLTRTCVNAYVAYLQSQKKVEIKTEKGLLVIAPTGMEKNYAAKLN